MDSKRQPAQILVITLFVLMILAIIVVGVVAVANKDVLQATSDQAYNELYDAAERSIISIIDQYGSASTPLTNLTNSSLVPSGYSCTSIGSGQYRCTRAETGITNELLVRDTTDIVDYELGKDDSLTLSLNNYRGEFQLNWAGEAAIEFALHYYDTSTATYGVITDVYDNNTQLVFNNNGGDPLNDPLGNHPITFQTYSGGGIRFNLASTVGINANRRLDYMRMTVRMRGDAGSTLLSIRPATSGLPNQVRVFEAASYASNSNHVLAQAITQVPLFPQIINILNYGLLTGSGVTK